MEGPSSGASQELLSGTRTAGRADWARWWTVGVLGLADVSGESL